MANFTQASIWKFEAARSAEVVIVQNKIGPFEAGDMEATAGLISILRLFNCNNYDACLTFAARKNWGSFTCRGCRKAELHGKA